MDGIKTFGRNKILHLPFLATVLMMKGDQGTDHSPANTDNDLDFESNSECSDILGLPPEIISLILIKLSVKTLSMLKCVNTYFSRVVSSQEFVRNHFKLSTEDASMSGYKIIIEGDEDFLNLKQTSVHSLCHESEIFSDNLDYPEIELQRVVWLVRGSCNGLVVVIVNKENMFIWNPAIRKHKKLPTIVGHENLEAYVVREPRLYCGFGFDASSDDYKVVTLFPVECEASTSKRDYVVNVYSLKRDSWVRIQDFTIEEFTDISGVLANGKLHWCTMNGDIVSFDVEREVFGTLEHPKYAQGLLSLVLRVLGGSITVCCYYWGYADVWVMKEYGIKESWTKMFMLSDYCDFASPQPCYILPNGEVLNDDQIFDIYNPKDNLWRSTGIRFEADTVIYVESLVSPCCN